MFIWSGCIIEFYQRIVLKLMISMFNVHHRWSIHRSCELLIRRSMDKLPNIFCNQEIPGPIVKFWTHNVFCKSQIRMSRDFQNLRSKICSWLWALKNGYMSSCNRFIDLIQSAPYWLYIVRLISGLEHYYSLGTHYDGLVSIVRM